MADDKSSDGDITITALYTSWCWRWANLSDARVFSTFWAWSFFFWVNLALWIARLFISGLKPLHVGLVHRHTAIDHLLAEAAPPQVLEIAAGLSRRGAAFSDQDLRYVELDLPKMIAAKETVMGRSDRGRALLARTNLVRVAADARQVDLTSLLAPTAPAFVIAEGLMMYLPEEAQRELWTRVAQTLRAGVGGTFVFDLVPTSEQPEPGRFGRALGRIMARFTRGQTFERDRRTRKDIREALSAVFDHVRWLEPGQVAREWRLPHPDVDTQQLLFVCEVAPADR